MADVDAMVAAGSAIDGHAHTNTTSVYTAAEIFPMLPQRLSTDLTSLGEARDRLAIVVEMTVDSQGAVTASDVYRARVRNQAKLAYDSVATRLDGAGEVPAAVAAQPRLADQLRAHRRRAGLHRFCPRVSDALRSKRRSPCRLRSEVPHSTRRGGSAWARHSPAGSR